ncbi:MAG TPA: corrinoid protein [Anaerolineales bacterium]|nr:corrinoid protein [Anaerolineales bacterium]
MDQNIQQIYQGIVDGRQDVVETGVAAALEAGIPARTILEEGMLAAMAEVGRQFEESECYVPEMMVSARAMKAGVTKLQPSLRQTDVRAAGKVALGTVKGDLHDLGKNLVGMMLEGSGFTVRDLGVDVDPQDFVAAADDVDVIGLSALLTTTMGHMRETLKALESAGKRSKVKVIVGGAPVTEAFASQIGADGFAADASRAVALTKSLVSRSD